MYRNAAVRLENWKVRWNSAANNLKIWGEFSIEKEQDEKRCLEEIRTEQEQCLKDIQVRLAANQKALAKIQKKSKDIIELEQNGLW